MPKNEKLLSNISYSIKHKSLGKEGFGDEIITVDAYATLFSKESLATAEFLYNEKKKFLKVLEVGVNEDFRRQGIATHLYDYIEKKTGFTLLSGDDQSDESEMFWDNRK